jgi:transposase-like protein
VSARVSPTDRIHARIDALFAQDRPLPEVLEEVARLGAQLLMQAALEAEVTEFLGRDRYQRAATAPDARPGSRNGYRPVTVKTTAGPVELERPKLRGTTTAFASRLFGKHVTKTNALESLVIASFVRGLSVRDVEATLAEALGDQAAISKSTVSSICQAIKAEYEGWTHRRLDGVVLDYLFLDASFFRMHPGSPAEPALAAWGITTDGKPVFVGLAPGSGESTDAWADFLTDLRERGLPSPLLVISDGAAGLIAAIEQTFPKALRQRCLVHRARNVLAKIPTGTQAEIRDGYWALFDTKDLTTEPGPRLVELIDARITAFADKYAPTYPAAMKILRTDAAGLTAYLRFPAEHHMRIRHSNFIERTFGETRRRAKVIGRFPGETSCISLVWAVLDRASAGWRGLTMTPVGLRLLQDLRRSLLDPPRELRPRLATALDPADQLETVTATA